MVVLIDITTVPIEIKVDKIVANKVVGSRILIEPAIPMKDTNRKESRRYDPNIPKNFIAYNRGGHLSNGIQLLRVIL